MTREPSETCETRETRETATAMVRSGGLIRCASATRQQAPQDLPLVAATRGAQRLRLREIFGGPDFHPRTGPIPGPTTGVMAEHAEQRGRPWQLHRRPDVRAGLVRP